MTTLFPYLTLFGDLTLKIVDVAIDGQKPDAQVVDLNEDAVDLFLTEKSDWGKVTVMLDVSGPPSGIQNLDEGGGNIIVTAVASCGATNVRSAAELTRSGSDASKWSGTLDLARSSYSGEVRLKAIIAGTVDGRDWRFLKESNKWELRFDPPSIPPVEGSINVKWVHFTSEEQPAHPLLRRYSTEAFYADLESNSPVVYLNLDFEHLQELLEDRIRRGPEYALHEAVRASIAAKVWAAMFGAALGAVIDELPAMEHGSEGAVPSLPVSQWQQQVLRRVLAVMFDDKSTDAALEEVVRLWRSEDGATAVQSHLTTAVEKHTEGGKLLRRAARRIYEEV